MRLIPRAPGPNDPVIDWKPELSVTLWDVQTSEQLARLDNQLGRTVVFAEDDCLIAEHSLNPDVTCITGDYGCILLWNSSAYYPPLFGEDGRFSISVRIPEENNITVRDTLTGTERVFTVELDISRDHPVVISTELAGMGRCWPWADSWITGHGVVLFGYWMRKPGKN
jgi:hypothetical protein